MSRIMWSITSEAREAPIHYHWYTEYPDESGPMDLFRDLVSQVQVDPYLEAHIIGEFASMLSRMTKGKLKAMDEIKPVRISASEPLFELRATFPLQGSEEFILRVYNAEPPSIGSTVIGLHMHRKVIVGSDSEIKALQNLEINKAVQAYYRGKPGQWGLPR